MKKLILNLNYFAGEALTILKMNRFSNILSFFSIVLAFFLLSLVISTWWISVRVVDVIQQEAEMSVFAMEGADIDTKRLLAERITLIDGVHEVKVVDEAEAYGRMVTILGEEAGVLSYFDDNPFESFVEARIDLNMSESVYADLRQIREVRYIRDNRDVLNQVRSIARIQRYLGLLFMAAAGAATLVIISHIIRQGVYHNRAQINTLRLLGAPESFIVLPFLIVGLGLTVGGGLMASLLTGISINLGYAQIASPIPFIPLPTRVDLIGNTVSVILVLSFLLGIGGSLMGLKTSRDA
jgi:cell division transport system permease protein